MKRVNPDLRVPEISNPADEPEMNLHGDVQGSPYSSTPGEMTLADAHEKAMAEQGTPKADAASTRDREMESRETGVPTEVLAAEDDAEGDAPKVKPKPKAKQ